MLHSATVSLDACREIRSSCFQSVFQRTQSCIVASHSREQKHACSPDITTVLGSRPCSSSNRPCVCPSYGTRSHDAIKPLQSEETTISHLLTCQKWKALLGSMFCGVSRNEYTYIYSYIYIYVYSFFKC